MRGKLIAAVIVVGLGFGISKFVNDPSYRFYRWDLMHEYIPLLGDWFGINTKYNISRSLFVMQHSRDQQENKIAKVSERLFSKVRTLVYQPRGSNPSEDGRPAIIYIHNGGWIQGVPESAHSVMLELVRLLNVVVVAFDYRKAPEHIFPAGYYDCLHALIAFGREAKSYGVNPFRLALMGDGSGGNLAASIAGGVQKIQERGFSVKLLVLFNPLLQALDFNLPSHKVNERQHILKRDTLLDYWLLYVLGHTSKELRAHLLANNHTNDKTRKVTKELLWDNLNQKSQIVNKKNSLYDLQIVELFKKATTDPRVSPILLPSSVISRVPLVYLVTCEHDVVRDEGIAWLHNLKEAGVRVIHHHYDFYHGILSFYSSRQLESLNALKDFTSHLLRNALL